jgi:TLC domain
VTPRHVPGHRRQNRDDPHNFATSAFLFRFERSAAFTTMCRPEQNRLSTSQSLGLLLTLKSYETTNGRPSFGSCVVTGIFMVAGLTAMEMAGRYMLETYLMDSHPILSIELNRHILARHLFVDAFSCFLCAAMGWAGRDIALYPVMKGDMPKAAYDHRLLSYSPHGFRLSLFFFAYQIKNLYDTIVWNDGPEFVFHHILSLGTAYGAMNPGCGHFYTLFFFGLSELSTAVLCMLANFDDVHGVIGMGDAFPLAKVALGGSFVILFILFRCIIWPIYAYYFIRDIRVALASDEPRAVVRRGWMKFFLGTLSGLTILQIAWLGQIFVLGKKELEKAGFL